MTTKTDNRDTLVNYASESQLNAHIELEKWAELLKRDGEEAIRVPQTEREWLIYWYAQVHAYSDMRIMTDRILSK